MRGGVQRDFSAKEVALTFMLSRGVDHCLVHHRVTQTTHITSKYGQLHFCQIVALLVKVAGSNSKKPKDQH
eukprot:scaffold10262_cov131-Chaetoceros_neogracile.AAC.5